MEKTKKVNKKSNKATRRRLVRTRILKIVKKKLDERLNQYDLMPPDQINFIINIKIK